MRTLMAVLAIMFLATTACYAGPKAKASRQQRLEHADRNKDGSVDAVEMRKEKQWEADKQQKANSWWKKQADTDASGSLSAEERQAWKEQSKQRIDLNADGTIDGKERGLSWRHGRAKVNTDVEKKFDANADGFLQPEETRLMLQDKAALATTHGKAKVDSAIEKEYDANGDGVIDSSEAAGLKQAIEQQ